MPWVCPSCTLGNTQNAKCAVCEVNFTDYEAHIKKDPKKYVVEQLNQLQTELRALAYSRVIGFDNELLKALEDYSRNFNDLNLNQLKEWIDYIKNFSNLIESLPHDQSKGPYWPYQNLLNALPILTAHPKFSLEEKKGEIQSHSNISFRDLKSVKCDFVKGVVTYKNKYSIGLEFDSDEEARNFITPIQTRLRDIQYQNNTVYLRHAQDIKTALDNFQSSYDQTVIDLINYIKKRLDEPKEHHGIFSFGYSKSEKIEAAFAALSSYMHSNGNSIIVTPRQKKILCNGRLSKCIKGIDITEITPQEQKSHKH